MDRKTLKANYQVAKAALERAEKRIEYLTQSSHAGRLEAHIQSVERDNRTIERLYREEQAAHAQTRAVLADALAERLPPWLAGLANEKQALAESLRGYNETSGCECGYTWHWRRCQLGRLLRIVVDGETQRQVDAAHEEALLPQMRVLDYWISSLPAERDFPCNCWSALPWSDDLSMHTHNCNRARSIRHAADMILDVPRNP